MRSCVAAILSTEIPSRCRIVLMTNSIDAAKRVCDCVSLDSPLDETTKESNSPPKNIAAGNVHPSTG